MVKKYYHVVVVWIFVNQMEKHQDSSHSQWSMPSTLQLTGINWASPISLGIVHYGHQQHQSILDQWSPTFVAWQPI